MWLDFLALGLLALFAGMGAWRGGLSSGLGLLTLVLSYAAAVFAAQGLGPDLADRMGRFALLAPVVAGTGAFAAVSLLGGIAGAVIKRLASDGEPPGGASRFVGGVFGGARGLLVVLLIGWLAIWLDAAKETGSFPGLEAMPETEHSVFAKVTGVAVEGAVEAAVGEGPGGKVMARMAARPAVAVRNLQALLDDPRLERLQKDRFFWTLIENKAVDRAMNRSSFRAIARDEAMRARMAELGVISSEAAVDPAAFKSEVGIVLAEVGPRLRGISEDPELQQLARDPEIAQMLENGNTLGLVQHEGVQRLVARVSSRP